ncbi:uncharacterized protein prx [Aplochiton taeniatus]
MTTVKDKRQSPPPSDRPSLVSLPNLHHSGSTDEQESPERVVQKERLHAELKQVLSLKRSHLRASSCQLAEPEMDMTVEDAMPEVEAGSELVEVMVETEAEAGASGYSVTGGGVRGIFVKDVLKDSPAAKHLSLQQGDQLLSAKVYFDNVKYEDALKILQCAEPYKVSFLLKRTIPGADVTVHPATTTLELKGPKAKVPKMSVKNIKPFKVKKKRGGRFGLKRLKENRKGKGEEELEDEEEEEEEVEGSPSRLEMNPVDVEFSLPKFKQSRDREAMAEAAAIGAAASVRKKRRIRFPRMKAKSSSGAVTVATGGGVDPGKLAGQAAITLPDVPDATVKTKGKGHKFGIHFPKTKKTKSDPALATGGRGSLELQPTDIKIRPPSVEVSMLSGSKDLKAKEKEGAGKFQTPGVEFSLPSGGADVSLPKVAGKAEIEAPEINVKGGAAAGEAGGKGKTPKTDVDKGDAKLRMPKLKLTRVRLSRHSDEIDGEVKPKGEGPEKTGLKMPHVDVAAPSIDVGFGLPGGEGGVKGEAKAPGAKVKHEGEAMEGVKVGFPKLHVTEPKIGGGVEAMESSVTGPKIKMPSMDVTLPKARGSGEISLLTYDAGGTAGIKMPAIDISVPDVDLEMDTGHHRKADEIEGPSFKGPHITMPKFDISLPKLGSADVELEGHEMEGKVHLPTVDFSTPKVKSGEGDVDMEAYVGGGGKLPEGEVKVEGPEMKGGKFEMPTFDVSLPKMKSKEGEVNIKGPEFKGQMEMDAPAKKSSGGLHMPTLDISVPKFDLDLSFDADKEASGGGHLKMPSMPKFGGKVKGDIDTDVNIKGDIKAPKMKGGVNMEVGKIEGSSGSIKLPTVKLPTVDISAPKVDLEFGLSKPKMDESEVELLKVEGGRPSSGASFELPDLSLKMPKFSLPKFGGKTKSGVFEIEGQGPKGDISLSTPQIEGEVRVPSVDLDGDGKVKMKVKKPKIKMPSFGISKKDTDVSISGPDVDVHLKKGTLDIPKPEMNIEGPEDKSKYKLKFPKFKKSSPKGKLPEGRMDLSMEGGGEGKGGFHIPDVTIKMPKFSMHGSGSAEGDFSRPGGDLEGKAKVRMPSVELKLPASKSPEMEMLLPKAEVDVSDADIQGYEGSLKIPKMPSIDVSSPKIDLDVSLPKVQHEGGGGKYKMPSITMPDIDLSLPRGRTGGVDGATIGVEGEGGKFKMPLINMPDVDFSLPKGKSGKVEGSEIEIKGDGGKFKMPKIDISLPKGKSGKIEGPEIEMEGGGGKYKMPHVKMPNVDLSLPTGKSGKIDTPDVDVEIEGKGGKFKMPHVKMPNIDISIPKGKAGHIEGPEIEVEGERGRLKMPDMKMPNVDFSLPKFKSGDINTPDMDIESESGKLIRPDVDFSIPKGKSGKIEGPDIKMEGEGGRFKMPHIKMPNIDISLPKSKSGKIDKPDMDLEIEAEGGKFKMPHMKGPDVDLSLTRGKTGKIEGPEMDIRGEGGKCKMPHVTMPAIDISLPKGKYGKIEGPDLEIKEGGGKFKMPGMNMPNIDFSSPKVKSGDVNTPDMDIEAEGGHFKMPHIKMPHVDISLPKGKTGEIEGPEMQMKGEGGRFKMPHFKMPNVDINLPKGKTGGMDAPDIDVEIESEGEKFKMPHVKMPSFDVSLPKGKADIKGPEMEMRGEGGKFKMPKVDLSLPKGKHGDIGGPDFETEGEGGKFKLPHVKLPNMDFSLSKGKSGTFEAPDIDIKGEAGKIKMPHATMPNTDISLPKGKGGHIETPGMTVEAEGGKFKMPHIKMPNVDLTMPMLKTGEYKGSEMEIKGEGGKFKTPQVKMPNIDISLPKGKAGNVHAPDMDVSVEGGTFPTVDVTMPTVRTGEADVRLPSGEGEMNTPGMTSPGVDLDVNVGKPKHGFQVEDQHKGMKLKMPTMDIGELELDTGLHRGKKGRKKIELPDVDLSTSGSGGKVKGPKVKGTKFKIGMPKMKNYVEPSEEARKPGKEKDSEGVGGLFKIKKPKLGKGSRELPEAEISGSASPNISLPDLGISVGNKEVELHGPGITGDRGGVKVPAPEVTLPTISVQGKQGSATGADTKNGLSSSNIEFRPPRIPDIEFDIGASDDEDKEAGKGRKMKIPKFGVALPSISPPEGRMNVHGYDILYEGPKMPKVKKAVFVLVDPPPEQPSASTKPPLGELAVGGVDTGDLQIKLPKIKMKPTFGKSGSKERVDYASAEREVEGEEKSKGGQIKMPKVSFSPGKSGSFDVSLKGEGSNSSLNGDSSKDDKAKFSGKIKMPKVELTSPYCKVSGGDEGAEMAAKLMEDTGLGGVVGADGKVTKEKSAKMSFPGYSKKTEVEGGEEARGDVVSSFARTEMLDRDSSESPSPLVPGFALGFSSGKAQAWGQEEAKSREQMTEERETNPWFRVPKFHLKPHSTGFLQITPEGSPQGRRRGEVGETGEEELSGTFRLQSPTEMGFTCRELSEQHHVTAAQEGGVTMVTETTKRTVTMETRTAKSTTTTTQKRLMEDNY